MLSRKRKESYKRFFPTFSEQIEELKNLSPKFISWGNNLFLIVRTNGKYSAFGGYNQLFKISLKVFDDLVKTCLN